MSLTGATPAASAPASPTARSAWRSSRAIVLTGTAIVLAAVLSVLLGRAPAPTRPLDPDDTSLSGSRALAELLRGRGVTVEKVDSVEAAAAKGAGGDHLLLITDTTYLDHVGLAMIPGDRMLVGDLPGTPGLAPGVTAAPGGSARTRSREPECDLPAATAAGSAYLGGARLRGPSGSTGCYPVDGGYALVRYRHGGSTITVVGDGSFMTNQRLAEDGNAALALNLIGTGKPVIWVVRPQAPPPPSSLPGESGASLYDLMPDGVRWGIYMAIIAVAVTAFWRGRRLGPVVVEKLPVVVRAAETVEGRGRLYRARRARERAADALRAGTIDRLTPRLGLASGAAGHEVVSALAARTGDDPHVIGDALYGPPPQDDAGLVALARYLDSIERTVSEL